VFGGEVGDNFEQFDFAKRRGDDFDPPVGGPVYDIDLLLWLVGATQMRFERLAPGR
jgi:hypothetical protein